MLLCTYAIHTQQRYQDFYQAIEKEAALSKLPIHTVYYEQLQDDLPSTMQVNTVYDSEIALWGN
jgi:hypothetical protein